MGSSIISLGLGLGGGKSSTSSGRLPSGGGVFSNTLSSSFDGTDDYLNCGTVTAMNGASSFTLSGWFKFDADNSLFWTGGVSAGDRFAFYLKSGGGLGVYIGSPETLTSASTLSLGQWYHIAVIKDGNGVNDFTLYIDGSLSDTGNHNATMPSSAGQNFWIGSAQAFSGYEMQGKADELAFWSTALTSSDITAIYNSGVPADLSSLNPVHWWRMGDGTGDTDSGGGTPASGDTIGTVVDQGSGSNNASTGGAPTYSSTVP